MRCCNKCFWCRFSFDMKHIYKCKLYPSKRFDRPKLKGWFCRHFVELKGENNES